MIILKEGDKAPAFKGKDQDGKTIFHLRQRQKQELGIRSEDGGGPRQYAFGVVLRQAPNGKKRHQKTQE